MKVSKAIEINTDISHIVFIDKSPDRKAALKLGIEALKRHQKALKGFTKPEDYLLPGETPEKEVIN